MLPLDFVDMFHACDHLTPNGVFSIEKICGIETDEELTVGAIGKEDLAIEQVPDMLSLIEPAGKSGLSEPPVPTLFSS